LIKVAIFGGSFDPPHQGHQFIVQKALDLLEIDKLIIIPTFLNPFKSASLATASMRLSWCHKLFDQYPRVEVSDYEISLKKPVYTSETLRYFQQLYNVRYLIIGADNLSSITKWYAFEWLNQEISWVVAHRKEYPLETEMLRDWVPLDISVDVSSTDIREKRELEYIDKKIVTEVASIIENTKTKI